MKKLLLFTIALVLLCCAPVHAANVNTVKAAIVKHSIEMGVDPAITLSIAKTESGFRQEARSYGGAVGVFQLMPSTARRMGYNPYLLDDNIKAGIAYYKSMYKMFGSVELALAAYNAGPGKVKRYKAVPPYKETRRYVSRIMADYSTYKKHPDPSVDAYKKQVLVASKQNPATIKSPKAATTAKLIAGSKAPLPIANIEHTRTVKTLHVDQKPKEVTVKSQSIAI